MEIFGRELLSFDKASFQTGTTQILVRPISERDGAYLPHPTKYMLYKLQTVSSAINQPIINIRVLFFVNDSIAVFVRLKFYPRNIFIKYQTCYPLIKR